MVADASKFGGEGDYPYWSPMPPHWTLISDSKVRNEDVELLRSGGLDDVVLVDPANMLLAGQAEKTEPVDSHTIS